jgi:ribosome biogenesis GTPase A
VVLFDNFVDLVEQYQNQKSVESSISSTTLKTTEPDVESEYVWGDETAQIQQNTKVASKVQKSQKNSIQRQSRVLNRLELIYFLTKLPHALGIVPQSRHRGHICVGLVGFPNVGKSSVINTILGVSKSTHGVVRVGVSSTPGKTKHFQTLDINDELMLCDCPGLVFPSFMRSRGDMVCAGILPINQMRDYFEPANIMASRIPQHLLEAAYGIHIRRELDIKDNPNRPPTGSEFLSAYCAVKGFITAGTGRWDEFRACKEVLRDYNDGRILYVAPPPPMIATTINSYGVSMDDWLRDTELTMSRREIVANRLAQQKLVESDRQLEKNDPSQSKITNLSENFSEMVFGDGNIAYELNPSDENYVYVEDGEEGVNNDEGESSENPTKREHKRLKHWGKKNRKLRDKNPYDDDKGVYIVHTTNRTGIVQSGGVSVKPTRTRRQDPHYSRGHETAFIRSQPIPPPSTS